MPSHPRPNGKLSRLCLIRSSNSSPPISPKTFDLPLAPEGTTFQLEVWAALQEIPYGETISYLDLAHAIGNPDAVRAVGLANGKNPLSIIVPCHRVIGSDGKLVGYGGGLPIKEALLKLEGALQPDPQLSLF